ncbi:bone morphogenetic protein 2 [Copidosoma floridanum]|uniref:bone morphogenetic protein 2 n=1 Tax=Copidosoma floridanum TaxID=29053 RepID=UPI0006C9DDF6|nr:bone morphogenetic protein 2 [Copidosoma floridanum]
MGFAKLLTSGYHQQCAQNYYHSHYYQQQQDEHPCISQQQQKHETPTKSRLTLILLIGIGLGFLLLHGIQTLMAEGYWSDEDFDDELSAEELAHLKSSMLKSLGLTSTPDIAKANVSQAEYERAHKEYMTRLRRSAEGTTDDGAHIRRLFTMYARDEPMRDGAGIELRISASPLEGHSIGSVESAVLRFLLDHRETTDSTSQRESEVRVYSSRNETGVAELIASRTIHDSRRRWIDLDLTSELEARLRSLPTPIHLIVQLWHKRDDRQDGKRPLSRWSATFGTLNVHAVTSTRASRVRRSASTLSASGVRGGHLMSLHRGRRTECRGESKKCCRHHMHVKFTDIEGFDFIIQPRSFDAGFCRGRCPPRYNPATHHAILQSLMWKENRTRVPRPCCAPSKLEDIDILYFDEEDPTKLKVSNWKDMKVLECACS